MEYKFIDVVNTETKTGNKETFIYIPRDNVSHISVRCDYNVLEDNTKVIINVMVNCAVVESKTLLASNMYARRIIRSKSQITIVFKEYKK